MPLPDPVNAALQIELAAFHARVEGFCGEHEGEYVVMRGVEPLGFYPSYEMALEAGYARYELDPFLVKRVRLHEEPGFLPICSPSHAEHQALQRHSSPLRRVPARGGG